MISLPIHPHRATRAADRTARRAAANARGQSLVEFALVIPILLFLTLIALDFGRVYLGYINLQNMSRIAANFAANNPSAWDATAGRGRPAAVQEPDPRRMPAAINCTPPGGRRRQDRRADPDLHRHERQRLDIDLGDTAQVQIGCSFGVITPGIANVVGGSVQVAAASSFPVKSGMTATGPGGGGGSAAERRLQREWRDRIRRRPSHDLGRSAVHRRLPRHLGRQSDRNGRGRSRTAGSTSTLQDPRLHTFTAAGTYLVDDAGNEPVWVRAPRRCW